VLWNDIRSKVQYITALRKSNTNTSICKLFLRLSVAARRLATPREAFSARRQRDCNRRYFIGR